jgi:hypothetical protein
MMFAEPPHGGIWRLVQIVAVNARHGAPTTVCKFWREITPRKSEKQLAITSGQRAPSQLQKTTVPQAQTGASILSMRPFSVFSS